MDVRRHVTAGRLSELFGEDRARDRRVRPHHGLAPGRRAGAGAGQARDPRRARGLRRRRQRLPRRTHARRELARRVHRAPRRRPRLPARAVDAGRLAGLAQGDGLGPARQHDRRDRPGAGPGRPHAGSRSRSCTRPTPTTSTRRSSARARSSTASSSRTPPRPAPGSRSGRRTPPARGEALRRLRAASTGCPRCSGRGDGHRQQRLGGRRRRTPRPARRCWPTTRTSGSPCPGVWMQMGLHCRDRVATTARSTSPGFTFSGVPGVIIGHNADIAWGFTNLGPDVSDLYLERVDGDRWRYDGRLRPLAHPHRDDRGRAAATTSSSPSGRPRTDRCCPTSSDDFADGRRAGTGRPPRRRRERRVRRGAARGPRSSPAPPPTRSSRLNTATDWDAFRAAAAAVRRAGAEPRLRRPRGPHRLPGAGPDPDPQVRQRRLPARPRAGAPTTTGPATTSRSTGCRACSTPRRGSSSPPTRR